MWTLPVTCPTLPLLNQQLWPQLSSSQPKHLHTFSPCARTVCHFCCSSPRLYSSSFKSPISLGHKLFEFQVSLRMSLHVHLVQMFVPWIYICWVSEWMYQPTYTLLNKGFYLFYLLLFIVVYLFYNVVLVSTVQWSESVLCLSLILYLPPTPPHSTHLGHHRVLSWAPCAVL